MKLRQWYSVYLSHDVCPVPSAMLGCLRPPIKGLVSEFEADDKPWTRGRFRLSDSESPAILVAREGPCQAEVVDRLQQMQSWLDKLEDQPHCGRVTASLRCTRQIVHFQPGFGIAPGKLARMCEQLCGFLVGGENGLIQVYQEGFFSPEGHSLLPFSPRHRLRTT